MGISISRRSLSIEKRPLSCRTFILSKFCHSWLIVISGSLGERLERPKALAMWKHTLEILRYLKNH